jgi:RNA polymerase sigma factor (TIGR02999 family)
MTADSSPLPPENIGDVTALLLAWRAGDDAAREQLISIVYGELHRQAGRAMRREGTGHTLQATALVNEAYLRLIDQERVAWRNRAHFFGVAAQLMRRILVDHARTRQAAKRGGGARALSLADVESHAVHGWRDDGDDILALHSALERLAGFDPFQARVVELRYFAGLSIEETAAALDASPATIKREWTIARGWLKRELDLNQS